MEEELPYEVVHGIKPPTWGFLLANIIVCLATGILFGYLIWGLK